MPPYRQPTPSPPPPPVDSTGPSPIVAAMMSSSSSSVAKPQGPANDGSASGGFELPPNFVPPPPPREVATGVSNLGNTCYMNAALQALAHAPELCHALDCESHLQKCPVALRNERRRRKRQRERAREQMALAAKAAAEAAQAREEGKTSVEGGPLDGQQQQPEGRGGHTGNKKSHRRSNSSSSNGSNGSKGSKGSKKRRKEDANFVDYGPDYEYCTLCEVERLLGRVHARPEEVLDLDPQQDKGAIGEQDVGHGHQLPTIPQDGPFVPENFVSGFMGKVAPWFRRGVQEDSHEFLRLLIDAMQNSCKNARGEKSSSKASSGKSSSKDGDVDEEYPFRLFRGTVESNVKCSACRSTSCKIDPIEDIGLDILPIKTPPSNSYGSSTRGGGSRSTSPTTPGMAGMGAPLADVTQALDRFISSEHLDSGYKCEKCGKLGKATKTSKLASIPPILTLHLKRFRYGSGGGVATGGRGGRGGGYSGSYNENGADLGGGSFGSSTRKSRNGRGGAATTDFDHVGPSGSAKIEGHVAFNPILDIKPYLTKELTNTMFQKMAICRLFAVVCHTGKNSHSGHYVAYVHSVTKRNEWWKMDDAKVVRSSWEEVRNAEAYMLFYRVTSHPVAMRLKSIADAKETEARRVVEEMNRRKEDAKRAAEEAARAEEEAKKAALEVKVEKSSEEKVPETPQKNTEDNGPTTPVATPPALGKRARPKVASGKEWANTATSLGPEYLPLFSRIQEFVSENVTFSPEFFEYITEEYNRMASQLDSNSVGARVKNKRIKTLLGKGPRGVFPEEDVVGGAADIRGGILDLFHQISTMYKLTHKGENPSFLLPKIIEETIQEKAVATKDEGGAAPTRSPPAVEGGDTPTKDEVVPPEVVPASPELIIATENECFDGAL